MTTILVPTSGTETDTSVFATALALAQPLRAHMRFYHLRLTSCEAAARTPHVDFCVGSGINTALDKLERRDQALSSSAARSFLEFCEKRQIPILDAPMGTREVSAQWLEETNDSQNRMLFHAMHSDLTVLGRRRHTDLMPADLIESVLINSGRPVVIAPDSAAAKPISTVVVGWKESGECARALTAAMPLLKQARQVILLTVREAESSSPEDMNDLVRQLRWNGVAAELRILSDAKIPVSRQLTQAAADAGADLLVVGGFGHSSLREHAFGGVTQELLDGAELPVFMVH